MHGWCCAWHAAWNCAARVKAFGSDTARAHSTGLNTAWALRRDAAAGPRVCEWPAIRFRGIGCSEYDDSDVEDSTRASLSVTLPESIMGYVFSKAG